MKRICIILATMMMAVTTMAQQKVAILETVDKSGKIGYGIKLLLRSSLTSAISNTPGYEGYDRVDMASIAGEQEFQRTGNVSDSQIKQLGIATGAAYVLVAEAAEYDEQNIIITAKILDVETFGVNSSAVLISGTRAAEMRESCASLASQLLKPIKAATPASTNTSSILTPTPTTTPSTSLTTVPGVKEDNSSMLNLNNNQTPEKKGKYKSPGTAWFWSFIIPGTGQFYNGQWGKGFRFLFFTAVFAVAPYYVGEEDVFDTDIKLYATWGAAGMAAIIWIWNWIDAPVVAHKMNKRNGYTLDLGERTNLNIMPTMDYLNLPLANKPALTTGLKLSLSF